MAEHPKDLIQRTYEFAVHVRRFVNRLPRSISNQEDSRQLVRASGSVAANYLESQEGLSRKDFFYRVKVCRKESREAGLWLRLVDVGRDESGGKERTGLVQEADELKRIFSSIAGKDDTGD
jgi:four helix bundle protein